MTTFSLDYIDQDLTENTTQIRVEKVESEMSEGEYYFLVDGFTFCDTEGHGEESFLMSEIREALDITIPELIEMVEKENPHLNIESVTDNTDSSPSYYYKVDEGEFNDALESMFGINTGVLDAIIWDTDFDTEAFESKEEYLLYNLEQIPEDFGSVANINKYTIQKIEEYIEANA